MRACVKSMIVFITPYAGYADHGLLEPDDGHLIEIWASVRTAPQGAWAFLAEGSSLWVPYASKVFMTTFEEHAVSAFLPYPCGALQGKVDERAWGMVKSELATFFTAQSQKEKKPWSNLASLLLAWLDQ